MTELQDIAPDFVDMAHQIVWCSAATVDTTGRPRTRVLHPYWQWDGSKVTGWVATGPTPVKRSHLEHMPSVSFNYWAPTQDTCSADCDVTWAFDDETRAMVWDLFADGPAPVGYDPAMIPGWDSSTSENFAALRLDPYRLRVMPGAVLLAGEGETKLWKR